MSARGETRLWLAQRASAAVLALCVAVHLATMIVAVRGGLSAADLLGRTRGSLGRAAHRRRRMARLARTRGGRGVRAHRHRAAGAGCARHRGGDAVNAWRNRGHAAYWAFLVHRISGLALALFLPLHFTALAQALQGE